jgi:ribosomal protein S6--L-glutamate ligase
MLIHILSFSNPNKISEVTQENLDLLETAAHNQGHKIKIIFARHCQMQFDKKLGILVEGKSPKDINVLLVRANYLNDNLDFKSSIIKQFQLAKVPLINTGEAVMSAKNKLKTMQVLSKIKIPIPKTCIVSNTKYIDEVVENIGSFPVILKTVSGSHGQGVSIIESKRGLRSVIEMVLKNDHSDPLLIQEYVKESKGKDIRVFILGHRIIGAMERIATKRGEFRSNFHLGGKVRVASMSKREKAVAFASVKALGLDMAGVDLLRTKDGPKVLEVNANPGLEGITIATERDIAGEIIKYSVKKARRAKRKIMRLKEQKRKEANIKNKKKTT